MPKISIQLKESSQPIEHEFTNTYQKGTLYCVYCKLDEKTYKYPIADIWRIAEDYGKHQTEIAGK
jgi:hypothetical protein